MGDISVLYLSRISRPPGMGHYPHTHDYWHFILAQRLTSEESDIKTTFSACCAPGTINAGSVSKSTNHFAYNIMFLVHNKSLYRKLEAIPFGQLSEDQLHVNVLDDIMWKIHDLQPDQEFIDYAFGYYLQLVLTSYQKSVAKEGQSVTLAEKAIAFIEENYMHPIRLEDVAEHIGRSVPRTSRLVKETTGLNVVEHMREIRIKNACRMLAYSDTPIEEIIDSCGFISPSYFHKVFREKVGTTPARYRTSHMVKHTFYNGEDVVLDEPYTQNFFTYIPGAQKCIHWKTPREYFEQKPNLF